MEYYAGTEGNGMTVIDGPTWLTKPGSVGRPVRGPLHICADDGTELPVGQIGAVYFESATIPFTYHNDPDKTRAAQHPRHLTWTTLGDIGYLDADGYLFLTDRKAFMIISGGVNIYPQETENALALPLPSTTSPSSVSLTPRWASPFRFHSAVGRGDSRTRAGRRDHRLRQVEDGQL